VIRDQTCYCFFETRVCSQSSRYAVAAEANSFSRGRRGSTEITALSIRKRTCTLRIEPGSALVEPRRLTYLQHEDVRGRPER